MIASVTLSWVVVALGAATIFMAGKAYGTWRVCRAVREWRKGFEREWAAEFPDKEFDDVMAAMAKATVRRTLKRTEDE